MPNAGLPAGGEGNHLVSAVLLDSSPLGILTNPSNSAQVRACRQWAAALQTAGWRVLLPEIIDYELRRELIHRKSLNGLANLNWYRQQLDYLPLTTAVMDYAADLWAAARWAGLPTAGPRDLNADVILAAQALTLGEPSVIVATTNVAHLSRFVPADVWQNIHP
jgi:hypothetical protein